MAEGYLLELVQCALSNANTQNYLTSNLLKQAQRIATHRKDFINLWWILLELQGNPQGTFRRIDNTMKAKFVKEDYESYGKKYLMKWIEERSINELNPTGDIKKGDQVFPYSIYDIEDHVYYSLIKYGNPATARAYENYKAVQTFKRLKNTTDESILGLLDKTNLDVIN